MKENMNGLVKIDLCDNGRRIVIFSHKKGYARKIRNAFKRESELIDELDVYVRPGMGRDIKRIKLIDSDIKNFSYGALKFKFNRPVAEEYKKTMIVFKTKPLCAPEPIGYGYMDGGLSFIVTAMVEGIPLSLFNFEDAEKEQVENLIVESALMFSRLHNPPTIFHGDPKLGNIILSANSNERPLLTLIDWEKMQEKKQKTSEGKYGFDLLIFVLNAYFVGMIKDEKTARMFIDMYRMGSLDREIADSIHEIIKKAIEEHRKLKLPANIFGALTQPPIREV
ncbi:MAG: hypothetical protein QXY05_01855 [Candidatus Anstonellales archaeon]